MVSYEAMTTQQGWFSMTPILSYARFLMMICGPRSIGKSVGCAIWIIYDYLKNKHKFVYTRRTRDTLELTAVDWFASAVKIMHNYGYNFEFSYDSKHYYIDGELCGYALPLNAQQKVKGKNFDNIFWLIYDEFIAFDGERYLGSQNNPLAEYRALMSLAQTLDRTVGNAHRNEVKIIALGNAESFYNPLFMGSGADKFVRTDAHFIAPKGLRWIVQMANFKDSPASKDYEDSVFYQLSDERTKAYAYGNIPKEEMNRAFVKKLTQPMKPLCNFIWDGQDMGFYADYKTGIFYVSHKKNYSPMIFALNFEDHRPNYQIARNSNAYVGMLKKAYDEGHIFFETHKIKYYIDNFLNYVV